MFVIVLSRTIFFAVDVYTAEQIINVEDRNTTFTCSMLADGAYPIISWLTLAAEMILNFGMVFTYTTLTEFVVAQAPCQTRGFVVAFAIGLWGILALLHFTFDHFTRVYCVPYVVHPVITIAMFVLFVLVSRRYSLRKRNDVIPYHMFAEDQFESNYKQERDYLNSIGWIYS